MNPRLSVLFEDIEKQRHVILATLRGVTPEQLNKRAAQSSWSAAEIVAHLIAAERLSLNYMKKKVLGVERLADTGVWEDLKMLVLKWSQRLPGLRFKAPRVVVENTQAYNTLAELEAEWNLTRADLKTLLENMADGHHRRKIYKHVIAGYLNVMHSVVFFGEHVRHHTPQIKRAIQVQR